MSVIPIVISIPFSSFWLSGSVQTSLQIRHCPVGVPLKGCDEPPLVSGLSELIALLGFASSAICNRRQEGQVIKVYSVQCFYINNWPIEFVIWNEFLEGMNTPEKKWTQDSLVPLSSMRHCSVSRVAVQLCCFILFTLISIVFSRRSRQLFLKKSRISGIHV